MKNVRRKGNDFEREASSELTNKITHSVFRRIPSSGAIGTTAGEPLLTGDISGKVEGLAKTLRGEAKVGYGGSKQFALRKDWLDKIAMEADSTYSIPFLIGKFSGAREGVRTFVVLDIDTFAYLINTITDCTEER